MHNEVNIPSKKWKCSILHKRCPFFSAEQTVRRWTSLGGLVLPAKIVAKFSVKVKVFRWWKTTKWSWLAPVTNEPSTSFSGKECVERTEEYWLQNWVYALFLLATLYTSWTVCKEEKMRFSIFYVVNGPVVRTSDFNLTWWASYSIPLYCIPVIILAFCFLWGSQPSQFSGEN